MFGTVCVEFIVVNSDLQAVMHMQRGLDCFSQLHQFSHLSIFEHFLDQLLY